MSFLTSLLAAIGLGPATPKSPKPPRPSPPVADPVPDLPGLIKTHAFDVWTGNLDSFEGLPVRNFAAAGDISDFAAVAPRVQIDYDSDCTLADLTATLLDQPGIEACRALVIGAWQGDDSGQSPQPVIDLLIGRKDRLPNLGAIFFGDISQEQNELSWIHQGDYSAFWAAFPKLEIFQARGSENLKLGPIRHGALRKLVIQSGGLPAGVAREATAADAPLQHLELWLGDDGYGATTKVVDFQILLSGAVLPELKYLGLCNSDYADDLAIALAGAPLLGQLDTLDLSKGTLRDAGGEALLNAPHLAKLQRLIVSHHYMSAATVVALKGIVPTLAQSPDDPLEPEDDDFYYIAVSE